MRRRKFLHWLGAGAAVFILPHQLRAQKKMHRLAFVHSEQLISRPKVGAVLGTKGLPNARILTSVTRSWKMSPSALFQPN